MANTTLKALKNTVDVIGRVKEVNLELGTTRDGKENIKGNVVVLVEESVNGETRSHDIRVRVYSNKFKLKRALMIFEFEFTLISLNVMVILMDYIQVMKQ